MKLWNLLFSLLVIFSTIYPIYQSFDRNQMKGHWHFDLIGKDTLGCEVYEIILTDRKGIHLYTMDFDGEFGKYNNKMEGWKDYGHVFEIYPFHNLLKTPVYECFGSESYSYRFKGKNLILSKPGWENQYLLGSKVEKHNFD